MGYDYTGTDVSKGLLDAAQENNPGAKFYQMGVYDMDFPDNGFDGFWACAVLLHLPKSKITKALQSIHDIVCPEGVGFISLKEGEGEEYVDEPPPDGKRFSPSGNQVSLPKYLLTMVLR